MENNLKPHSKKHVKSTALVMSIVIIVALLIQGFVLSSINKTSGTKTTVLLLNHVIDIIDKNIILQSQYDPESISEPFKIYQFSKVISNMPTEEGISIFIANSNTRIICASSDSSKLYKKLDEIGIRKTNQNMSETTTSTVSIDGFRNYVSQKQYDDYIVIVSSSTKVQIKSFIILLGMLLLYLLIAAVSIFLTIKREEHLLVRSNTDPLTGLFNRRAYEEDIKNHDNIAAEDNLVYFSLDLNGLKIINDSKGHEAGDEIIAGTASCLKRCLEPYGRAYRIGGDEFCAVIHADSPHLVNIKNDLDNSILNWTGRLVDHISVSYGYVQNSMVSTNEITELAAIAEKRMYEAKSNFYKRQGIDRRGQKDAHTALCALYTKILKINLTDDTYQIVNMNDSEKTESKGFASTISEWLKNFALSGQVHPEDVENYLSKTDREFLMDYFLHGKTSISIFYRRKDGETYNQVIMEMIPATDYSPDNQSLFLYVKAINI